MAKKKNNGKVLYWTPRILAVAFILFISMFALDVFGEYGFPEVLVALFMHLVPSFLLIAATAVAWKNEKAGGILFLALGIVTVFFFRTYSDIISFLIVSMPVFVIGGLFILNWYKKKK